jgi:hypothetical protein
MSTDKTQHWSSRNSGTLFSRLLRFAVISGSLAVPLTCATAQDTMWELPWQKDAKSARPAPTVSATAPPSRLGGTNDPDAPPAPYSQGNYGGGGSYGSSPSYGNTPSYGTAPSYGSTGGTYGNSGPGYTAPAPAPQGGYGTQAQGYGNQGAGNQGYGNPAPGYGAPQGPQQGGGQQGYGQGSPGYDAPQGRGNDAYQAPRSSRGGDGYGAPYSAPGQSDEPDVAPGPAYDSRPQRGPRYADEPTPGRDGKGGYYSQNEISNAGHGFFGSLTRGMASAIEHTFQKAGRPNGYILGEDGGGAFIAGLRYGEGTLFTKDVGQHKVYWQGPSLGYDIGAEGSKTMVLVYNMRDVQDLFNRFGGIEGSAYLVGGVSVQFQKHGDVSLALIRSGVGLRLGANVGYLKYSQRPTWNPF